MTIISWPYPTAPEMSSVAGLPPRPERPAAVLAVLARKGGSKRLASVLADIARSREAAGLRLPTAPIAVLVLASEPAALPVVEEVALDYPFPIQVQLGPVDLGRATRLAAGWAASLGAPGAPVLVTDVMAVPSRDPVPREN